MAEELKSMIGHVLNKFDSVAAPSASDSVHESSEKQSKMSDGTTEVIKPKRSVLKKRTATSDSKASPI